MKTCAMIAGNADKNDMIPHLFFDQLDILYWDYGVHCLISGVHRGMELESLSCLVAKKHRYPKLEIEGFFTHEEEASSWLEEERETLYRIISQCSREVILRPVYGSEMRFQRNIMMMDLADVILLLGRDRETEFWAAKMKKPMIRLDMKNRKLIPEIRLYR